MLFSDFSQTMLFSKAPGVKVVTTWDRLWIVCLLGEFGQKWLF